MSETIPEFNTVQKFLDQNRNKWTDFNVPFEDGQQLEKLILKNNCKSILEIGTSSGHSTIWLAKAVAKTGGKITTIELNEERLKKAEQNFKRAEVSHLIEMIKGNAIEIIPKLNKTFDFVFSDATWMKQPQACHSEFFRLSDPKISVGGIFAMHNVIDGYGDDGRLFKIINALGTYETSIIKASHNGISVSKKINENKFNKTRVGLVNS